MKLLTFASNVAGAARAVSVLAPESRASHGPSHRPAPDHGMMGSAMPHMPRGLVMPEMNAERGRELFGSKGCVVCHAVNDIGGHHTPLDAATMPMPMNPFEFAAKMWRGAEPMIFLQREELGYVIDLTGDELADIIAFVHDEEEQRRFSRDDFPPEMMRLMERDVPGHAHDHHHGDGMPHEH
jgi:cytochrome c